MALLFPNLPGNPLKDVQQIPAADGLQQIFLHVERDGLPGIGKIVVSAENDGMNPGHGAGYLTAQLQPVHKGHADIRNQNIRLHILKHVQGDFPVGRFSRQYEFRLLPRKIGADSLPYDDFIIHQKHLKHGPSS